MRKSTKIPQLMLLATSILFVATGATSAQQPRAKSQAALDLEAKVIEDIQKLQTKVDQNPDDALTLYQMGGLYLNIQYWQDAIVAYRRAVQIKPDFTAALYRLGWTYTIIHNFSDALKAHQQALSHLGVEMFKFKVSAAEVHYAIGWDHYSVGRWADAIASYKQALDADPNYQDALYEIGRVRIAQGNREEVSNIAKNLDSFLRDRLLKEMSYALPTGQPGAEAGVKSEDKDPPVAPPRIKPFDDGTTADVGVSETDHPV